MRAHIDLTTFIVIAIVVAAMAALVSFVGPKLTEASNVIADVQYADQRAQLKIQNEQALAAAHANELNARLEISKTQALAQADVQRTDAQTRLLAAQGEVERIKTQGARELAQIEADAKNAARFWQGVVTLGVGMLMVGGLWVGNLIVGNVMTHKNEAQRIEAQRMLLASAIEQMPAHGGKVTLENGRAFEIYSPPTLPTATQLPALAPPVPVPITTATPSEDNHA